MENQNEKLICLQWNSGAILQFCFPRKVLACTVCVHASEHYDKFLGMTVL